MLWELRREKVNDFKTSLSGQTGIRTMAHTGNLHMSSMHYVKLLGQARLPTCDLVIVS